MNAPCQRCSTPSQVHFHERGCPFAASATERERRVRCLNLRCPNGRPFTARNDGRCSDACAVIAARALRPARGEGAREATPAASLAPSSASLLGDAGRDPSANAVPATSREVLS